MALKRELIGVISKALGCLVELEHLHPPERKSILNKLKKTCEYNDKNKFD